MTGTEPPAPIEGGPSTLEAFARHLEIAQRKKRLADRSRPWCPSATPATDLGYQCDRRIVYHRTQPEAAAPLSEELASIFTEGKHHERQIRVELAELGFEVVESEVTFRDEALDLVGTIDGRILMPDPNARHGKRRVTSEIKSCTGNPPKTQDDLKAHPGLYGRYYSQFQTYQYLASDPEGLFLFKDKITGLWSIVPVELDYGHAETLLQRAERVRDHVSAGTLPERIDDRSECPACPWKDTACHPEETAPDPALIAIDFLLEQDLVQREALDPARRRYKEVDDRIKQRFKLTRGDLFVCGDYTIRKKKHGRGVRIDIERSAEKATGSEGND